jgi:hypothetical protein
VPFLRVIRDKRGYETTYLMHWYREGNRQHSRILYVFRSPGGVRVGRDALEPDVLRQLERQHPDIAFDWKVVRENQQVVETAQEPRRRRPARQESEAPPPAPPRPPETEPAPPRVTIPSRIEGDTPDAQIAFLTQLYPVVRERIPQRTPDPERQEVLLALADRLNPVAWTDADQITTGLQQAAEALERLSHVFSRRRRRGRKKPRSTSESGETSGTAADDTGDAGAGGEDPDQPDFSDPEEGSLP